MSTLYLLRHAESTFNASNQTFDEVNAGLSAVGEQQARALVGNFNIILISPMHRCQQTLELSKIEATEVIIDEEAREMKTDRCDFLEGEPHRFETEEDIMARVQRLRERLWGLVKAGKKVLLLSHYWVIWYLTSKVIDDERFGMRMENGTIEEYEIP